MAKKSIKSRVSAALKKSYNKKAAATISARTNPTTSVVDRAKAMLGTAYNPNTKATTSVSQTVDKAKAMLAQTKAEGSNSFAGSSFEKTYLAKYPAPTDASQVGTPFPPLNTPALGPDLGNISDAVAGNKGLEAMLALQQKQAADALALEEKRQTDQKGLLDKFMGSVTSPWQAREQAIEDTGIDPQEYFAQQEKGIKEIESLTNDYNSVIEAKDAQIAATQDKMGSMNFINNQTAQIERNAAPQLNRLSANINAKAATLQALQGNFAEARSYVNQAVQDATADTKFKYDMMKMTYDMNEDSFDRVDSIYSDAYKGAMAIAQMQYEEDLATKQLIGEYMLKYPSAGLTMQDSLEDASKKIAAVPGTSGKVDLTADMKNYEYAVAGGYKGTFAEWVGKTGGSWSLPKEVFSMGGSDDPEAAQQKYRELELLGLTSSDIIQIQNDLNAGKTLKEIAEESGMPTSLYLELQNNYITKFGE